MAASENLDAAVAREEAAIAAEEAPSPASTHASRSSAT
jgi:hypothetical protein